MGKVILVLCDGLRDDTAREMMGFLEHMVETRQATRYRLLGELPTVSRPIYETVHTGTPVSQHGVTSNLVVRPSRMPNIFSEAHARGLVTAASAYHWISELYNGCPFRPTIDREVDNPDLPIQHGRFYTVDPMPDEETFLAGQTLLAKYMPDLHQIHPKGMDKIGHTHGPESNAYRNNAILIDTLLATGLPGWLDEGYHVFVTADHGISRNNSHAGTLPEVRDVPLYILSPDRAGSGSQAERPTHLCLAPTILQLMRVPVPASMKTPPLTILNRQNS